jgi:predicted ester cyclase
MTHQGSIHGHTAHGKILGCSDPYHLPIEGGKIVDHWMVIDTAAFMQQLGMTPSNEGTS